MLVTFPIATFWFETNYLKQRHIFLYEILLQCAQSIQKLSYFVELLTFRKCISRDMLKLMYSNVPFLMLFVIRLMTIVLSLRYSNYLSVYSYMM